MRHGSKQGSNCMKKVMSLVLAFILLFSVAVAATNDYSSLSDADLRSQLDAIRNEMVSRKLTAEGKVILLDEANIQVYVNGTPKIETEYSWTKNLVINIPIVIINNTDKNITLILDNISVNGWTSDGNVRNNDVPSGKKAKGSIILQLENVDIDTIDDFESFEFYFQAYNSDDWFGKKPLEKSKIVNVYAEQIN